MSGIVWRGAEAWTLPSAKLAREFDVVEDSNGNPVKLTNGTNRALFFTWLGGIAALFAIIIGTATLIGYAKSERDAVFEAGMKEAQRVAQDAQEQDRRHAETEAFRKYETDNDAALAAIVARQTEMQEMILQALGKSPPPEVKVKHPLRPAPSAFWLHEDVTGSCCLKRERCNPVLPMCATNVVQ
jgi:hypothetical protein